jgi:hypothetical protein
MHLQQTPMCTRQIRFCLMKMLTEDFEQWNEVSLRCYRFAALTDAAISLPGPTETPLSDKPEDIPCLSLQCHDEQFGTECHVESENSMFLPITIEVLHSVNSKEEGRKGRK